MKGHQEGEAAVISAVSSNEMGSQWGRDRGGLFQTEAPAAAGKGLSHFTWMHKLTGSASEGLVESEMVEGSCAQGGKTMPENEQEPYKSQSLWNVPFPSSYLFSVSNCPATCLRLIREYSSPGDKLCVDFSPCFPHCLPLSCFAHAGLRDCHPQASDRCPISGGCLFIRCYVHNW